MRKKGEGREWNSRKTREGKEKGRDGRGEKIGGIWRRQAYKGRGRRERESVEWRKKMD